MRKTRKQRRLAALVAMTGLLAAAPPARRGARTAVEPEPAKNEVAVETLELRGFSVPEVDDEVLVVRLAG